MNLFSKDRDIIHRINNLVLIVWLVIAIFFFYSSFVDLFIKMPVLTYEEFEVSHCNVKDPKIPTNNDNCQDSYKKYKLSEKDQDYYAIRTLINSAGNMVIVGLSLFLLNKNKKKSVK